MAKQSELSRFKFHKPLPIHINNNRTLSHLAILLLSISCVVELNPGPDFPCGSCGNEVLDSDHAVECDKCNTWFHITCQNLDTNWYSQLVENDLSFVWTCTLCECLNLSNSSSMSVSTNNSFSSLVDENFPTQNSLPTYPQQNNKSIPKQPIFVSKLKILGISWLKKDHYTSEFFPPSLGYTALRNDRLKGKGGGVFLIVKNNLVVSEQSKLQTNCEIVWVKHEIKDCKPMYISSYYRPHESDLQSLLELEKSLDLEILTFQSLPGIQNICHT
ncbi:hypothetical protein MAR_014066 [Mya arenaria]|uniref:PHD-type domain-containing protein n=1 Tax=Mya arenaria TaxID=6604 RepID=A0ABY7G4V6_MYAAR|nr:hypothetical protein MAR_014066 [Mya arenaria]